MNEGKRTYLTLVGKGTKKNYDLFECVCGRKKEIRRSSVRRKHTVSCGCMRTELTTKHGMSKVPEYWAWAAAKDRCRRENNPLYPSYGGRGLNVCARWLGESGFAAFYADMGDKPTKKHSIDRIDNDKGYWCGRTECPECGPAKREPNCRWGTDEQQARNRRSTKNVTHAGRTQCMAAWADEFGVSPQAVRQMVKRHGVPAAFERYLPTRADDATTA